MIRTSEQITELSDALARAQSKFGAAIKGSQNPAFRSKYADLSAVIDATLEHLNAEGITCMQHPALEYKGEGDSREAMITVTTRLQHKSGQFMESDLSIPAVQRDRFDAQSCGSAITYACRYALQSICLVPREDDDGNAATGTGTKEETQRVGQEKTIALKRSKAQESHSQTASRTVFVSRPAEANGHFFAVAGYVVEEAMQTFFADTNSQRFKSKLDQTPYYRVPAEYEKDFLALCSKMEIEIQ